MRQTANDRFKESFGRWFWGSLAAAVLVHFALFAFWPSLHAESTAWTPEDLEMIDIPEVEIPPPPEQIVRPAVPVVSVDAIDEDITIAPTTFKDNPIENLPPPPTQGGADLSDAPVFTPMTVRPQMKNVPEVRRALERFYPPSLRDAGIGGTVKVYFFIDEDGEVVKSQVHESSGFDRLDEAALRVAEIAEFSPALNYDKKVPVWISLDLTFSTR